LTGKVIALLLVPAGAAVAAGAVALRMHFQPPTVPGYVIAGDAGAEVTLRPGAPFGMVVRPTAPVTGIVGARGFLFREGEHRPWEPSFMVAVDGTVSVTGTRENLFPGVPPGDWDIAVAIGRPETLPTRPDEFRADTSGTRSAGSSDRAFVVVHERVHLVGP
jgi:hypothetical protein